MSPSADALLNEELADYLEGQGLPTPLARLTPRLSRSVWWKEDQTIPADTAHVRACLNSWFESQDRCKLVRSDAGTEAYDMQGVFLLSGIGVPKLVLASLTITPESAQRTRVTIRTATKVGRLSPHRSVDAALGMCELAAGDIVDALSNLVSA